MIVKRKVKQMSKMTDEQIKKALECCIKLNAEPSNFEICKKDCPYKFNCCDREKGISVEKDILDLINRQQKTIERLKADAKRVDKDLEELDRPLTEIRAKAIKDILLTLEAEALSSDKYIEEYDDSKEQKAYNQALWKAYNLVKEMAGEQK